MSCIDCCSNVLKITSVSVSDGSMFLIPEDVPTFKNGCKYILVIPCNLIPASTTISQVYIAFNDVNYPIVDRCIGNNVYSDQLRFICTNNCGNKVLRLVYGTSVPHFKIISQALPKSSATPNV